MEREITTTTSTNVMVEELSYDGINHNITTTQNDDYTYKIKTDFIGYIKVGKNLCLLTKNGTRKFADTLNEFDLPLTIVYENGDEKIGFASIPKADISKSRIGKKHTLAQWLGDKYRSDKKMVEKENAIVSWYKNKTDELVKAIAKSNKK